MQFKFTLSSLKHRVYKANRFVISSVLVCLMVLNMQAQTSSNDFGASTGVHTSGASTLFLPNPLSSGSSYVNIGAGGGSVNLENPGITNFGCATELRAVASSSSSVNKITPISGYTATTQAYLKFNVLMGSSTGTNTATSGDWSMYVGDGSMYTDGNDFSSSQVFSGLKFTFGAAGALTAQYRNGSSWSSLAAGMSQGMNYTVELMMNNTSSTINYSYGSAQTIAANTFDMWVNGTLVGNDLAKGGFPSVTTMNNICFIGQGSTANVANLFLDNMEVTNTIPTVITNSTIAISSVPVYSGSVNTGSTGVILSTFQLSPTAAPAVLNGLAVLTAGTYSSTDILNLKVRYSSDAILDAGDATLSTLNTPGVAGVKIFPSFNCQSIGSGATATVFVTADVSGSATIGNTINVSTIPFGRISFLSGIKTGTDPLAAGGVKTFCGSVASPPVLSGTTIVSCNSSTTLTSSSGASTAWYTTPSGGTAVGTGATYTTPLLAGTATYYAQNGIPTSGADTFYYTGSLQYYTVPVGVTTLTIDAYGAEGGYNTTGYAGGLGARSKGDITVTAGQVIDILVGQRGADGSCGTGGGGGSFVVRSGSPLIIAGGGGGGFYCSALGGVTGGPGLTTNNGGNGISTPGRSPAAGGTAGSGGTAYYGGGGGGFLSAGFSSVTVGAGGGVYPGAGGTIGGGYGGGGGYYVGCCGASGGGGGYSGGSSGTSDGAAGGGGGSYNVGTSQVLTAGVRAGNGMVIVSHSLLSCPSDRVAITVTVSGNPTTSADTTINACQAAVLRAVPNSVGDTLAWYDAAIGGTLLHLGTPFVTPTLSDTTTYYVENRSGFLASGTTTFSYTGAAQTFTVPAGVTSIDVEVSGAAGQSVGGSIGGNGGKATGILAVTPGQILNIYVGGQLGYNGGGIAGTGGGYVSGSGGGASDIRVGGTALSNRVIVGGGGGGSGRSTCSTQNGGAGAGPGGLAGVGDGAYGTDGGVSGGGVSGGGGCGSCCSSSRGGGGGGQNGGGGAGGYGTSTGGTGGGCGSGNSDPFGGGTGTNPTGGCFGIGGDGGSMYNGGGGGGGGGWYGGGAGGGNWGSGGGGGSSYIGGVTSGAYYNGVRSGNGIVVLTWNSSTYCATSRSIVKVNVIKVSTPSVRDGVRCGNGTVILSATPALSGETIDWYADSLGGSILSGGVGTTSFTTPLITSSTTYFAEARNIATGCVASRRVRVNATIIPTSASSIGQTICGNENYLFNGVLLNTAGAYLDTLANIAGCDSVVTLNLSVIPVSSSSFNQSICAGATYTFNGANLTSTGVYLDTFVNSLGCDSVLTLNLTVQPLSTGSINSSICNGASYNFNGVSITSTGVYKDTLTNSSGCDSVVTLNLTVRPASTGTISRTITTGSSYLFNGVNLTQPGTYKDTLTNVYGCDSIATLNLSVNTSIATIKTVGGQVTIFPNPTSRDATLSYTLPDETAFMDIVIIDEQGREMMQTKVTHPSRIGTYNLNLNGYASGIYFVKIVANGFSETKKLIVEKN